jgi:hypothetical protein
VYLYTVKSLRQFHFTAAESLAVTRRMRTTTITKATAASRNIRKP